MAFERGKNRATFLLKGFTYVSELYVNAERPGDALSPSKLLFHCGNCSRVRRLCSPVVPQYCCRARDEALKQKCFKERRYIFRHEVFKPIQVERHRFKRDAGTVGEKKSGESWRIQLKKSRMKGLNFKKLCMTRNISSPHPACFSIPES